MCFCYDARLPTGGPGVISPPITLFVTICQMQWKQGTVTLRERHWILVSIQDRIKKVHKAYMQKPMAVAYINNKQYQK